MKNLIVKLSAVVVTGLLLLLLFATFIKPAFALLDHSSRYMLTPGQAADAARYDGLAEYYRTHLGYDTMDVAPGHAEGSLVMDTQLFAAQENPLGDFLQSSEIDPATGTLDNPNIWVRRYDNGNLRTIAYDASTLTITDQLYDATAGILTQEVYKHIDVEAPEVVKDAAVNTINIGAWFLTEKNVKNGVEKDDSGNPIISAEAPAWDSVLSYTYTDEQTGQFLKDLAGNYIYKVTANGATPATEFRLASTGELTVPPLSAAKLDVSAIDTLLRGRNVSGTNRFSRGDYVYYREGETLHELSMSADGTRIIERVYSNFADNESTPISNPTAQKVYTFLKNNPDKSVSFTADFVEYTYFKPEFYKAPSFSPLNSTTGPKVTTGYLLGSVRESVESAVVNIAQSGTGDLTEGYIIKDYLDDDATNGTYEDINRDGFLEWIEVGNDALQKVFSTENGLILNDGTSYYEWGDNGCIKKNNTTGKVEIFQVTAVQRNGWIRNATPNLGGAYLSFEGSSFDKIKEELVALGVKDVLATLVNPTLCRWESNILQYGTNMDSTVTGDRKVQAIFETDGNDALTSYLYKIGDAINYSIKLSNGNWSVPATINIAATNNPINATFRALQGLAGIADTDRKDIANYDLRNLEVTIDGSGNARLVIKSIAGNRTGFMSLTSQAVPSYSGLFDSAGTLWITDGNAGGTAFAQIDSTTLTTIGLDIANLDNFTFDVVNRKLIVSTTTSGTTTTKEFSFDPAGKIIAQQSTITLTGEADAVVRAATGLTGLISADLIGTSDYLVTRTVGGVSTYYRITKSGSDWNVYEFSNQGIKQTVYTVTKSSLMAGDVYTSAVKTASVDVLNSTGVANLKNILGIQDIGTLVKSIVITKTSGQADKINIIGLSVGENTIDAVFFVDKDGNLTYGVKKVKGATTTDIIVYDGSGADIVGLASLALGFDLSSLDLASASTSIENGAFGLLIKSGSSALRLYKDAITNKWRGVAAIVPATGTSEIRFWDDIKGAFVKITGAAVGTLGLSATNAATIVKNLTYDSTRKEVLVISLSGDATTVKRYKLTGIETAGVVVPSEGEYNSASLISTCKITASEGSPTVTLEFGDNKITMTAAQWKVFLASLGISSLSTADAVNSVASRAYGLINCTDGSARLVLVNGTQYTIYNLQNSTGGSTTEFQIVATGANNTIGTNDYITISEDALNSMKSKVAEYWNSVSRSNRSATSSNPWTAADVNLGDMVFNTTNDTAGVAVEGTDAGRYEMRFNSTGQLLDRSGNPTTLSVSQLITQNNIPLTEKGQVFERFSNQFDIAEINLTWTQFKALLGDQTLAEIPAALRDLLGIDASQKAYKLDISSGTNSYKTVYIDSAGNIIVEVSGNAVAYANTAKTNITWEVRVARYTWNGNAAEVTGKIMEQDFASTATAHDLTDEAEQVGTIEGDGIVLGSDGKLISYSYINKYTSGTNAGLTESVNMVYNSDGSRTLETKIEYDEAQTGQWWTSRTTTTTQVKGDNGKWKIKEGDNRKDVFSGEDQTLTITYTVGANGKSLHRVIDETKGTLTAHAEETITSGDFLSSIPASVKVKGTRISADGTKVINVGGGTDGQTEVTVNRAPIDATTSTAAGYIDNYTEGNTDPAALEAAQRAALAAKLGSSDQAKAAVDPIFTIYQANKDSEAGFIAALKAQYSSISDASAKELYDAMKNATASKTVTYDALSAKVTAEGTDSAASGQASSAAAQGGTTSTGGPGSGTTGNGTTPDATTGSTINTGLEDGIAAHRNMTPDGKVDNGEKYGAYGAGVSERLKAIKDVRSAQQSILSHYLSKENVAKALSILGNADMTLEQKRAALKALGLSDDLIELLLSGDLEAIIKAAQEQLLKDLGLTDDEIAGFFDAENKEEYLGGLELSEEKIAEIMGITDMDKALEALLSGEGVLSEEDQQKVAAILDWLNNDTDADGNIISNQKRFDEVKNALTALGLTTEEIDGLIGTDVMSFMDSELKNMTVDKARIDYLVNTVGLSEWTAKFIITGEAENLDSILTEVESVANELLGSGGKTAADAVSDGASSEMTETADGSTTVKTANDSQTTDPELEAKIESIKEAILTAMFRGTLTPDNASSMVRQIIEEALSSM